MKKSKRKEKGTCFLVVIIVLIVPYIQICCTKDAEVEWNFVDKGEEDGVVEDGSLKDDSNNAIDHE